MAGNELADFFSNLLIPPPVIRWIFAAASVIILTLLVRWLLYRFIPPLLIKRSPLWEDILDRHHFLHFLYLAVPYWLISLIAEYGRGWNDWTATLVAKSANIFSIIMVTAAMLSALAAYNEFYDQRSIAFVTADEKAQKTAVIEALYNELQPEARQNIGMEGVRPEDLRARDKVTNLELFMAYATMVIAGHPQTHSDSDVYARQEAPSPQGLPVGLYFSTRAAAYMPYYAVQREILSHMLAVLPDFDLRPYQIISGD